MLLFSTKLAIRDTMTKDEFIRLIIDWNQNSPHEENIIPGIEWNGERNIKYGNDKVWLDIEEYRNGNIIASRYEKAEDDGTFWDTDYVMNFNDMRLSIRLDRSFNEDAMQPYMEFSTPYFITSLIEGGYINDDGDLPVSKKPYTLENTDLEMLASVINQEANYQLPVVYVSKTYYGDYPVNIGLLASRLKGVAHVLVEKGTWQDSKIRQLCHDNNEYHGAIGVYYPSQNWSHRRFFARGRYSGYNKSLLERVIRAVMQYSNAKRIDALYTWPGVIGSISRDRLASQREERQQAESENRELVDLADNEIKDLQKQVEELTKANDRLSAENQGLKAKIEASEEDSPVIFGGEEIDFFPGEIREMILDAVKEAADRAPKGSRRKDVYTDILSHNEYQNLFGAKKQAVKDMFKGYSSMSKALRQSLKDLGFKIDEGKHYKLTYYGDGRYYTTIAKTGSDHREGSNISSNIIKNML
jgi:hypothetical protein